MSSKIAEQMRTELLADIEFALQGNFKYQVNKKEIRCFRTDRVKLCARFLSKSALSTIMIAARDEREALEIKQTILRTNTPEDSENDIGVFQYGSILRCFRKNALIYYIIYNRDIELLLTAILWGEKNVPKELREFIDKYIQ